MFVARFETEKLSGKNDFGLWCIKMHAMWYHQGLVGAIKDEVGKEKPTEGGDEKSLIEKQDMMEMVHSVIILCLVDNFL